MRSILVAVAIVAAVVIERSHSAPAPAAAAPNCQDSAKQCSTNDNCCSGCCQHGTCTRQSTCLSQAGGAGGAGGGACAFHQCPRDKECYLQKVQCITAPCNPVPLCRSRDPDYD